MKFFKITLFIVAATYSTWVFAQNNVSLKFIEENSKLTIDLAELEAKKSAYNFVSFTSFAKLEKPIHELKNLNALQKIENEIVLAIKDNPTSTFFDEKIKILNQENQKLKGELKLNKIEYFKYLDSIPDLEKEFDFFYEYKINKSPSTKSNYYLLFAIIVFAIMLLWILQIKVLSVRRWLRAREPERTFLFRWLGFGWILPILICSCQSGKEIELEFYNPTMIMEVEKQALKDKIKILNKAVEEYGSDFNKNIQAEPTKELLLRKCAEYLEAFKFEENLKAELIKTQVELKKHQTNIAILENESHRLKKSRSIREYRFSILFIGSLCILIVFIWLTKVHSAKNSKVCPRCFEFGTLVPDPGDNGLLQCNSKFCNQNNFRMPKLHQSFSKISFPVIGCMSAGKTNWLLNIYSLNKKSSPSLKKQKALYKIGVIDNTEFDIREKKHLNDQLNGGGSAQVGFKIATPPLIFSLKDNKHLLLGKFFRSQGLSLCFDYYGEILGIAYKETVEMIVRSNGIVLFLDVMNVDKTQIDFTNWKNTKTIFTLKPNAFNTQNQTDDIVGKAYAEFIKARGITIPNPLDIPVAICLTKIDLLPYQGPIKGTYGEKFLKELENCKHPTHRWSLSTIMDRSDIIRNYLPLIFAHKGMIEIFDQKFGSNYMFFPVANRGLEPDLPSAEPFGVMEPLLWLQHMHGFNVLDA